MFMSAFVNDYYEYLKKNETNGKSCNQMETIGVRLARHAPERKAVGANEKGRLAKRDGPSHGQRP
jgi:hypothetical protein